MGAGEKRARFRTRNGWLTAGNFSYYMEPVAQWVSGVTVGCGHLFGQVCPSELSNYWEPAKKTGPLEKENWVDNIWNFQLLHGGHRPLGFGRCRMGVGIYLGRATPMSY